MALDPSLILRGQTPNMAEAFQKGAANQQALYGQQAQTANAQAQLPGIQAESSLKQASLPYQLEGAKLDEMIKKNQFGLQLLSGATDEESYQRALEAGAKYGLDTAQMPEHYDPKAIQQMQMGGLQIKDRLDMMYKNIELGFKQKSSDLSESRFNAEYPNAAGAAAQIAPRSTLGSPNPQTPAVIAPSNQPDDQGSIPIPQKPGYDNALPIDGTQDVVPIGPQVSPKGQASLMSQPGAKEYASNAPTTMNDAGGQPPSALPPDDFQPQYNAKGEPMKGVSDGTQIYINPKTGERQERLPQGDSIYDKANTTDLHGEDYLKTIPDPVHRAYVKHIADGTIPLPTPRGKAEQQQLMDLTTAVKQYDDSFYSGRAGKYNDFRGGDEAKQISSFSKAIEHTDTLKRLAANLDNTSSPAFNELANLVSRQTGEAKVTNFNAAKEIVAKELDKVIAGPGGSTISGTEDAKAQIEAASSPKQLVGAIATIQELMGGQLTGLEQTYKNSVGGQGFKSLLTPKAAEVFSNYQKVEKPGKINNASGFPKVGAVVKGHVYHGGDPSNKANWSPVNGR